MWGSDTRPKEDISCIQRERERERERETERGEKEPKLLTFERKKYNNKKHCLVIVAKADCTSWSNLYTDFI